MQNKGALKFLAIALAIACAYQLSFTFVTRHVEKKAAEYAAGDAVKEQNYLDSIKSQTVYNLGFVKFNYKECKEKEINLGLDLRGGMNVMLEISVEDVVRALSNDSKDSRFQSGAQGGHRGSEKQYERLYHAFRRGIRADLERRTAQLCLQYARVARADHSEQFERRCDQSAPQVGRRRDRELVQRAPQPYRPFRRYAAQYSAFGRTRAAFWSSCRA